MDKREAADAIRRILNGDLDDCERALKRNDVPRALRELDSSMDQLRRVMNALNAAD